MDAAAPRDSGQVAGDGGPADAGSSDAAPDATIDGGNADAGVVLSPRCDPGAVEHLYRVVQASRSAPRLSATGRFVVGHTPEALVPADQNELNDVYLTDRVLGQVRKVSRRANASAQSIDASGERVLFYEPFEQFIYRHLDDTYRPVSPMGMSISADGTTIAGQSDAPLVLPDANGDAIDVYVLDLGSGVLTRASVTSQGVQPSAGFSEMADISEDGRFVLFASTAGLLSGGPDQPTVARQVFLRDRLTGITEHVSTSTVALSGPTDCEQASMSDDAHIVAFRCLGPHLLTGQVVPGGRFIYALDRRTGELDDLLDEVSVAPDAQLPEYPEVSADGRFVAFVSPHPGLAGEDPKCAAQGTHHYIYDRGERVVHRVGCSEEGGAVPGPPYRRGPVRWSKDGRFLTFVSDGGHAPGTADTHLDAFIYSFCPDQ